MYNGDKSFKDHESIGAMVHFRYPSDFPSASTIGGMSLNVF